MHSTRTSSALYGRLKAPEKPRNPRRRHAGLPAGQVPAERPMPRPPIGRLPAKRPTPTPPRSEGCRRSGRCRRRRFEGCRRSGQRRGRRDQKVVGGAADADATDSKVAGGAGRCRRRRLLPAERLMLGRRTLGLRAGRRLRVSYLACGSPVASGRQASRSASFNSSHSGAAAAADDAVTSGGSPEAVAGSVLDEMLVLLPPGSRVTACRSSRAHPAIITAASPSPIAHSLGSMAHPCSRW